MVQASARITIECEYIITCGVVYHMVSFPLTLKLSDPLTLVTTRSQYFSKGEYLKNRHFRDNKVTIEMLTGNHQW